MGRMRNALLAAVASLPFTLATEPLGARGGHAQSKGWRHSLIPTVWNGTDYGCKCYAGDSCWPAAQDWAELNTTVGGNLLKNVPPGAPCYRTFRGPLGSAASYNAAQCATVNTSFSNEQWTVNQPAAELWTYYTNETCRPTNNPSQTCTLGFYPVYVIMAKTEDHIKAGVDFARTNSLRLVIRNTGHDFLGRSTGWGALVINTHSFQTVNFTNSFAGPGDYHGTAVTIGAGVQGRPLLEQLRARTPPQLVVTGECPTVGLSGGLVQGGGHGPATTLLGLASDNALEFRVLTANGEFKTANAQENPDLFWALKGGGPGAYAVILSTTFRTYTDVPSSGMIITIPNTNDSALWWNGIRTFHNYTNYFVDNGLYTYFEVLPPVFNIHPIVAINKTSQQLEAIVKPFLDDLISLGVPFSKITQQFPTFVDLYISQFEDETAGQSALTGGWTFTRQDVARNNDGIITAFQNVLAKGGVIVGHSWDAGHGWKVANSSSTHPKFRGASSKVIVALTVPTNATWEDKQAAQNLLTHDLDDALRKAGKNGCAYINEADPYEPDWQDHFFGSNYQTLYDIRKKWDPEGVFYAVSTPGTEDWEVIDYGTKLCKKM